MEQSKPLVIAHRGASAYAPENTIGAFLLGVEQSCDMIELDIHLTKDEQIVVCHDYTLDRTTNGKGAIAELTYDEIRVYDAGSWFGAEFASERVSLLEDVLQAVPSRVTFNVEIKSGDEPEINRILIELLEKTGRMESTVVSSFNHNCLVKLKKLAPNIRIGLLYDKGKIDIQAFEKKHGVGLFSLHPHHGLVNEHMVKSAADFGVVVYPWTVDEEGRQIELIQAQVAGIITNKPDQLVRLLQN